MKLKVLKFLSSLERLRLRLLSGVKLPASIFLTGRSFIVCKKGGVLRVGEGVTIHSARFCNPVMNHRTTLAVVAPEAELVIGNSVGMSGVTVICSTRVEVGQGTLLGADCLILDNDLHLPCLSGIGWKGTYGSSEGGLPIIIEPYCFVGARSMILKGVTLGQGSVVAAGAVVTKSVPPYSLVYGSPMQVRPISEERRVKIPENL